MESKTTSVILRFEVFTEKIEHRNGGGLQNLVKGEGLNQIMPSLPPKITKCSRKVSQRLINPSVVGLKSPEVR